MFNGVADHVTATCSINCVTYMYVFIVWDILKLDQHIEKPDLS